MEEPRGLATGELGAYTDRQDVTQGVKLLSCDTKLAFQCQIVQQVCSHAANVVITRYATSQHNKAQHATPHGLPV